MTAFPSSLPAPLWGSFSEQRQRNVLAFKPDVGAPKLARRSTAVAVEAEAVFIFNDTQLAAFDTFYEDTLRDGTLPFTMDHPASGANYTWNFDGEQAPQKNYMTPGLTRVTCKLLRQP